MALYRPIHFNTAAGQVEDFWNVFSKYCIIYRAESLEDYINIHFPNIKKRQVGNIPTGYYWEVSFNLMINNGKLDFCVAPVLVKREDDDIVDVLNCFDVNGEGISVSTHDPNVSYTYDYKVSDETVGGNGNSIYDDGNMFP